MKKPKFTSLTDGNLVSFPKPKRGKLPESNPYDSDDLYSLRKDPEFRKAVARIQAAADAISKDKNPAS